MLEQVSEQAVSNKTASKMNTIETLRHIYQLFKDTKSELARSYERYGDTVQPKIRQAKEGKVGMHWVFGPEWNEKVYLNSDNDFSSEQGWEFFLKGLFPGSVMAMDGMEHRIQRRIMAAAFKKPSLLEYLDKLNPQIKSNLDSWPEGENFQVYTGVKGLTLDIATKVLMGADTGPNSDKINAAFIDAVNASIGLIRKPLPFTKQRKGEKGARYNH